MAARPLAQDNRAIVEPAHRSPPPSGAPASARARLLARASGWIVPEENPAGAVYGVIVIGALLAAESGSHETYLDTFASAVIAAALYWLADAYANVLGRRLRTGGRLTAQALWRGLVLDLAVVRGAAIPLTVILIGWVAGTTQETAVTAALWSAIACLFAFELIAGVRARAAPRELLLEAGVGLALGAAILALKVVLR